MGNVTIVNAFDAQSTFLIVQSESLFTFEAFAFKVHSLGHATVFQRLLGHSTPDLGLTLVLVSLWNETPNAGSAHLFNVALNAVLDVTFCAVVGDFVQNETELTTGAFLLVFNQFVRLALIHARGDFLLAKTRLWVEEGVLAVQADVLGGVIEFCGVGDVGRTGGACLAGET